jgi:hypothetical protein
MPPDWLSRPRPVSERFIVWMFAIIGDVCTGGRHSPAGLS